MAEDSSRARDGSKGGRSKLLTLAALDRRTTAYRRVGDLIAGIESDLGGADGLSIAERQIVQRAAMLGAQAEDLEARWLAGEPVDPGAYCSIINCQRRLFETVGIQRRQREIVPDLKSYLASRDSARPAQAIAVAGESLTPATQENGLSESLSGNGGHSSNGGGEQ